MGWMRGLAQLVESRQSQLVQSPSASPPLCPAVMLQGTMFMAQCFSAAIFPLSVSFTLPAISQLHGGTSENFREENPEMSPASLKPIEAPHSIRTNSRTFNTLCQGLGVGLSPSVGSSLASPNLIPQQPWPGFCPSCLEVSLSCQRTLACVLVLEAS